MTKIETAALSSRKMAETVDASAIVLEVLNKDNDKDWRVYLQTYLEAQDLWNVIEANDKASKKGKSEAEIKAWQKKNANALRAIYISCGTDAFKTIREIKSAKIAWETLEAIFGPQESSNSSDDKFRYQPFFDAVASNYWSIAKTYLSNHEAVRSKHPVSGQTALHIAAIYGYDEMVKELLKVMPKQDQEIHDTEGFTALLHAVRNGRTSITKYMVEKNRKTLGIPFKETSLLPVSLAFVCGNIDLARYLYYITLDLATQSYIHSNEPQKNILAEEGATLVLYSMQAEQYDIALDLLKRCPGLTINISKAMLERDDNIALLEDMLIAAFPTASRLNFWQQWIYDRIMVQPMAPVSGSICVDVSNCEDSQITRRNITCSGLLKQFASNARKLLGLLSATLKTLLGIKHLYKMKLVKTCLSEVLKRICEEIRTLDYEQLKADTRISNAIIRAIANGVVEFVVRLTDADPRLFSILDKDTCRNIVMIAVQYRQEKIVYSFFKHENVRENIVNFTDKFRNSLLHMTGLVPPSSHLNIIPGPALQMQKELQWFQEVESLMESKILKSVPNVEGKTAREYFTKNHGELRKAGEKWMKETSSSYSVVAALIITITFAAGFIVPGGGNNVRSLSHKKWFLVFIISDAVSLLSSTTSVLMFLAILTSRYYEEAFLRSLPTKLILGMSALSFSIATMMLCFCAALYEMLNGEPWILIPIIFLACVPVYLFISLQFPVLVDIFISTYGSGVRIAPKKDKKR